MTQYGHELKFGTFITPAARNADQVVALAVASETAGLDLVTFQDHPYRGDFLDTWTLLSFVAARTERVSISGNVINLPLRQPAVLARAAASLDRLSHGRVELGLGAGAFWEGIDAMGGETLTAGQSVDALEEAIDIIKAIWATEDPGGVRIEGTYHSVRGTRRGPPAAHPIGIWLGALKPRMLNLVGRKADGWLPSLAYLEKGSISDSNALIDAAAVAAGRSPHDIRRLVNLSGQLAGSDDAAAMADKIVNLANAHGFSTFILPSDDQAAIEMFGREVVPRVVERVSPLIGG